MADEQAAEQAAAAQGEQVNPSPLPTGYTTVLQWFDEDARFAVSLDGSVWSWRRFGSTDSFQWHLEDRDEDHAVKCRLVAEVVALRARVEELTALVESGYRDGWEDGAFMACERLPLDSGMLAARHADWMDSDTRKALTATSTKG